MTPPLLPEPELSKHFFWTSSLIPVCLQSLLERQGLSAETRGLVISAVFVLEQVGHHGESYRLSSHREGDPSVQQMVSIHGELRRQLFWERVARHRGKHGKDPLPHVHGGYGTAIEVVPEDMDWLLADAIGDLLLADRRLALETAAEMLWKRPLLQSVWELLPCAWGSPELGEVFRQYAWSRLRAPFMRVWYRHFHHKLLRKYWWDERVRRIGKFRWKIQDRLWFWRHLGDLRKGLHPYTLAHLARLAGKDRLRLGEGRKRVGQNNFRRSQAGMRNGLESIYTDAAARKAGTGFG